jgi:hypothetical protein
MNKIFVISLHRSGTQSTHELLLRLGLNATHKVPFLINGTDIRPQLIGRERDLELVVDLLDPILRAVDAASDVPIPALYSQLHERYPDARFFAVRRSAEDWVRSVRGNLVDSLLPWDSRILYHHYLPRCPARLSDVSDDELIDMHRRHHQAIEKHFSGNSKFAMFDLAEPDIGERICAFLGFPAIKFPYVNSGPIVLKMAQLKHSRSKLLRELSKQLLRKMLGREPSVTVWTGELPEVIAEFDSFRNSPSRLFRQFCSQLLTKSTGRPNRSRNETG